MLRKVKHKNGRIGYIEQYMPHGMCIVRYSDSCWGWCKEDDLVFLD